MNTNLFNFDFGPIADNATARMSMYGLAIKNKAGTYVSYDPKSGDIMDVEVFNFEGGRKFLYKMPVPIKDVKVGDVIVHNKIPMFVVALPEDGKTVTAVDPFAGERKEIMLTKSPFGFNFITKVVNLLGDTFNANAENPFGNLAMMMMLSGENTNDLKDMLPFLLFGNGGQLDMSNPLMMYALMGNGNLDQCVVPLMMLANGFGQAPVHQCGCNCGKDNQ